MKVNRGNDVSICSSLVIESASETLILKERDAIKVITDETGFYKEYLGWFKFIAKDTIGVIDENEEETTVIPLDYIEEIELLQ